MNDVQQVRSFNRTVTRRIGMLDASFLGHGLSLGHARTLFEIGAPGIAVRSLRSRLGLDSGYTSRLLRTLERRGLVVTAADPGDRRVRLVKLTPRGRKELARLGRLSDERARELLDRLSTSRQARLVAAMGEVERLMLSSDVKIEEVDAGSPDAQHCLELFAREMNARFEGGFDPRLSISAKTEELSPPAGCFIIARLPDRPVGCCALKFGANAQAEVKRMWVDPGMRGVGLGQRLLDAIEQKARAGGVRRLRLETNTVLTEAQALYRRNGFNSVKPFSAEPYAHFWFEKRLEGRSR